jgi:glycosyltransferase involved in cell wall biosynthesis
MTMTSSHENHTQPPTICMALYSYDMGGSERLGLQLCKHYLAHGFRVVCCATRRGRGPLMARFEELGIPCLALNLESHNRLVRIPLKARLGTWLREHGVTCLHAQHWCVLSDVHNAGKKAGVRTQIVTEHTATLFDPTLTRVMRSLASAEIYVVAVNDVVRKAIRDITGLPDSRLFVIENGVDTLRFAPNKPPCSGRTEIVWLGRFHPDKDVLTALEAFREATQRVNTLHLRVVGDGEERRTAEEFVRRHQLQQHVSLTGEVANPVPILQAADMFFMSSATEGTPLALLEALSCGLPVVATSVGGIPNVISPEVGILAPARDSVALAKGLVTLAGDEELRVKMGEKARQLAVGHYSEQRMAKDYIDLIERLNHEESY